MKMQVCSTSERRLEADYNDDPFFEDENGVLVTECCVNRDAESVWITRAELEKILAAWPETDK